MEFICFSLLIVWQLGINNANECPGKNGFACCHGYFWDRTENKCFLAVLTYVTMCMGVESLKGRQQMLKNSRTVYQRVMLY
ncbi:uncharacterized protein LOC111103134 isoform X3 [Crassostrea virginica]